MYKKFTKKDETGVLGALMENTEAQLAYLDNNFNFLKVNSAYARGANLKKRDLIGRNHFDLFPNSENKKIFERARDTGKTVKFKAKPFVFPLSPERGVTYWDWSLTPITNRDGVNMGLVFSLVDVTGYKITEVALKKSESNYRKLFDNMADAFAYHKMVFDKNGKAVDYVFLEVNLTFEKLTGLKGETIVGKKVSEIMPAIKEDDFDWIGKYGKVAKTGKKLKFTRYFKPLGRWFGVSAYCPERGFFAVTFKDVTGTVTAKRKMIHLASFPKLNPEPVLEMDLEGKIIFSNEAAQKILKEVGLGLDLSLFLPGDMKAVIATLRSAEGERPTFREIKVGERYFDLRIFILKELGVVRIYGHDISSRKKQEQKREEFFRVASHELKTPISSVKAYTQLITKTCHGTCHPQVKTYLGRVKYQVDKLTRLINNVIEVSRLQSEEIKVTKEEIEIDRLIDEVIKNIQITNGDGHKIILNGRTQAKIDGDRYRIGQALTNLLINAVEYSPNADKVKVRVWRKGGMVVIGVRDYGIGIGKEKQKELCRRLYQVNPNQEFLNKFSSLGLGLFISAQTILEHGGKIWLRSEEGFGSTFYFSLPERSKY
ncbi:MAG: PAS domain-containing sensor histidine kinase [Candidatus Shapirobacteria bacterium]